MFRVTFWLELIWFSLYRIWPIDGVVSVVCDTKQGKQYNLILRSSRMTPSVWQFLFRNTVMPIANILYLARGHVIKPSLRLVN